MKTKLIFAAVCASIISASGEVELSTDPDRVETPLRVNMKRVGTLAPRGVEDVRSSNWTLGCEVLDRDFAKFDEYKRFLAPLGIKKIRLQAGWAKCERVKGVYDFAWLDHQVDFALAQGIAPMLETGYGNPVYEGGGGWDLAGGFPSSDEGLAGWDAWVDALSKHFSGRVKDWAMWNEPDIGTPKKTPEAIASFNVRTAKIIRRNVPDARISGLSLAHNSPELLEDCLKAMGEDVKLFDSIIYHGYAPAPESSYAQVEAQKAVLAKYNPAAKLRQGENGCPSEMATRFALSNIPWSEYSQAKWDMRRMPGDLGHDVESSVFTICDFNHTGREINLKGLLRANEEKEVVAVKRAYYAVQNVVSVFDDTLKRVVDSGFSTKDSTVCTYEYAKADGARVFAFWTCAESMRKVEKDEDPLVRARLAAKHAADAASAAALYVPVYERPDDGFTTRPHVFKWTGAPLKEPVWVDLLTGAVYEFPKKDVCVSANSTRYVNVPVYDSPCLLAERAALKLQQP